MNLSKQQKECLVCYLQEFMTFTDYEEVQEKFNYNYERYINAVIRSRNKRVIRL